jgi:uncharacterized protein YccT (UPF0319 family)
VSALTLTRHATSRMAQRGISLSDIELISLIGIEVEGGYFVRDKDYKEIERVLKNLLHRLERVVGKRSVVETGQVITVYHPSKAHQRRLLR